MKKIIAIASVIVLFVYLTNCGGEEEVATPNARVVSILNNGGGLRFEWDSVDGADGYRVYVDGALQYEGTNTYFEWTTPAQKIEVVAYAGDKESTPKTFNFAATTGTSEIYERSGTGNSAFGWDANGYGSSYSVLDTANFSNFDFYVDDFTGGSVDPANIHLVSPDYNFFGNPFNSQSTGFYEKTTSDPSDIAPTSGNYETPYSSFVLKENASYFLWIDSNANDQIDEQDNFARIDIVSIGTDGKITFNWVYQPYSGLRWLK
jgi:hypothetical protein